MRTTLSIDDDVLAAVKGISDRQKKTVGQVLSELARQALRPPAAEAVTRNGVPLLAVRADAQLVTMELVNQLRDELL